MFKNIEAFYLQNHYKLIEDKSDGSLRPGKSFTKDVENCIDKFKAFYKSTGMLTINEDRLSTIIGDVDTNTRSQNLRVMREFAFLFELDTPESDGARFKLTSSFVDFVNSEVSARDHVFEKLKSLSSLEDFTMYLNLLLCTLREAYLYGQVMLFRDSFDKFKSDVPNADKRLEYRQRIFGVYGYSGRDKQVTDDVYSPNLSYMSRAELENLGLLIMTTQKIDNMNNLVLTKRGYEVLQQIDANLATMETNDALSHNFYGMHITNRNSALANSEINIGWSALGDLSGVDSKEDVDARYGAAYPDAKPRSKAQGVTQIWSFKNGMSIGDYVVFGDGSSAHIGVISSDYYYEVNEEVRDADYVNNRKVEWLKSFKYTDLPKIFKSALASARSVFSLNAYKSIILELLEKGVVDIDDEKDDGEEPNMEEQLPFIKLNFDTNVDCDFERNRIVFGAPGTGKSFQLEEDRAEIEKLGGSYERVTFHPEYTYSNFVGCYKPVSEKGEIKYKYVPGPFMRVLVEALRSGLHDTQAKPYLLLIEEINRAKVAAVFGEVFQLLDRDKTGKSDYEIHASEDVKKYLSDELNGSLDSFAKIKIPNNMFIWASMNSADQGVFPMDTAFKRRWSFEYKGIDENEDKVGGNITLGKGDAAIEINWNTLRKAINATLATKYGINEDKLLGPFFINEEVFAFGEDGKMLNPTKFIKVFKSKVIMYLYEDAAKQQKHKLFSGCDNSRYSSICDAFDERGIEIFGADFKTTYDEIKEAEASR